MEAVQEECFLKFIDRIDEETLQENTVIPEISIDPINDTYETILKFIIEEEARLGLEQRRNSIKKFNSTTWQRESKTMPVPYWSIITDPLILKLSFSYQTILPHKIVE